MRICLVIIDLRDCEPLFVLNRVCIIKCVIGKFDEADSAIREAVDGVKECFFNEGLYAWTLENLALLREAEKRTDDAAKIYAEAVSAYERICGFPSYEAAEALYHQSGCLLRMGKVAPAETAIRRAISVMDKIEQLSGYEESDYLATLASILDATGHTGETEEMRNRANNFLSNPKKRKRERAGRSPVIRHFFHMWWQPESTPGTAASTAQHDAGPTFRRG